MAKLKLDRRQLDHPEHFDDEIREFKHSNRYVPTDLERLLFELAAHRCTICRAPWMEIHHIDEISEGGATSFDNLIVLCPNCHTRVHHEGVPTKTELRHYKLKQEIAYELPVLSRLTAPEKELIAQVAGLPQEDQVTFSRKYWRELEATNEDEAVAVYRREIGLLHLQESGMLNVEQDHYIPLPENGKKSVALIARFTGKGVKWIRYLQETNRVPNT